MRTNVFTQSDTVISLEVLNLHIHLILLSVWDKNTPGPLGDNLAKSTLIRTRGLKKRRCFAVLLSMLIQKKI